MADKKKPKRNKATSASRVFGNPLVWLVTKELKRLQPVYKDGHYYLPNGERL